MTTSKEEVIIVEGLSKRFGKLTAVNDISFSVMRGEVFGILGPNGAGKTTTLECIEGILEPSAGITAVLGINTQKDPRRVKERIGVQLQASTYFDYLTLTEILKLFGLFYNRRVSPDALLSQVGLQDKAYTTVDKLSGGQKQRFTFAATLVNEPEVIFLDEPTTGLDPQARRNLWDFIQTVNDKGRTVVLTTHYMEEAEFLCHRVAIMDQGRIVAMDTPAKLIRDLPAPYDIRVMADNGRFSEGMSTMTSVQDVIYHDDGAITLRSSDAAATITSLMAWAADSGARVTHLEVKPANLEDVFLSMTGRALRE